MSDLIPLTTDDQGVQAVLGRDLHSFLEVKANYRDWFPRMVEYGFEAGKDYAHKIERVPGANGRSYEQTNHIISLDMAKELAMIQRTDKGKQARRYFIEVEKRDKAPTFDPAQITRSEILRMALNAEEERLALETENKVLAPKAEAYDSFLDADGKYGVGAVAKMLGTSQNKLFRELRNRGVFIAKGTMRNTPYQQYMHHFEVKPYTISHSDGSESVRHTTYVQPSGIDFIRRKLDLPSIDPMLPFGGAA